MKKTFRSALAAIALCFGANAFAAADTCPLPVMVDVQNTNDILSDRNVEHLTHKLIQAVAHEGYGGEELAYLCLSAAVEENDKQVISGSRPLVACQAEVYLVLSHVISGEKFGSTSIKISGAGHNDAQAFQKAFSQINPRNPELLKFLRAAHDKVFEYYNSHVKSIAQQATILTQRKEYEKALFMLSSVPPCVDDYDIIADALMNVWQTYINRDCAEKLANATAIWRVQKTQEAAMEAAAYIAAINRESDCVEQADALLAEISDKLDADYARQLALEDEQRAIEQQNREFGQEMQRHEIELRHEDNRLKEQEIESIRQIGLGFAKEVLGPLINNLSNPLPLI